MEAYSGYLTIKAFGHLKNKTYSNCWCILYAGKNDFPPHLDVYEDQKKVDPSLCKKSLDIINAKWGKVETPDPAFCVIIKGKRYLFCTRSEEDFNLWCQCLCCLSPDLFLSRQAKDGMPIETDMVMQDNVLYASSNEVALFDVVADGSQGNCARFGLSGLLKISVDPQSIKVFRLNSQHPVIEWRHPNIRSYGSSNYSINITAGKKSSTGEGSFKFNTSEGSKIVEQIGFVTNRLKDQDIVEHASTANVPRNNETKLNSFSSNSSTSSAPKKKPAPAIPMPKPSNPAVNTSPGLVSSNAFDSQFKNQLNLKIGGPPPIGGPPSPADGGKKLLEPKRSISSNKSSNESLSKKDLKKEAKEKAKLAKQQEKDRKKEQQERKKQEKEKQKQLEKLKKGKGKGQAPVVPAEEDDAENYYSEANDAQIVPEPALEGDYAECEIQSRNIAKQRDAESKLYNEPWGALPLHLPTNTQVVVDDEYDDAENMYASPMKPSGGKEKKGIKPAPLIVEESYEDVGSFTPPSIPPKLEALEDDDSQNNVYDHFAGVTPISPDVPENIYGLDSAKSLANNYESNPNTDIYSECTYETVG